MTPADAVAAALEPLAIASEVDQDASHGLGRGAVEMGCAIPGLGRIGAHQPEICLVDQGCGLERLAGGLTRQPGGGQPAQLILHQRQELGGGPRLAPANGFEHARHRSTGSLVIDVRWFHVVPEDEPGEGQADDDDPGGDRRPRRTGRSAGKLGHHPCSRCSYTTCQRTPQSTSAQAGCGTDAGQPVSTRSCTVERSRVIYSEGLAI